MTPPPTGIENIILAALGGIAIKILWDWLLSGRTKKVEPFITRQECEAHRDKFCIVTIKRDIASLTVRIEAAEKQLDQGLKDSREIKKELAEMNKTLARMWGAMEKRNPKLKED